MNDLNFAPYYNNHGVAYKSIGKYDLAITDFENALKLDPNDKQAKDNLINAKN